MTINSARIFSRTSTTDAMLRRGCIIVAFLVPLKLSLTYLGLIPLILLWLVTFRKTLQSTLSSPEIKNILFPLLCFLVIASSSALTGLNPLHSFPSLGSLLFFSLTTLVFATIAQPRACVTALLGGQAVAAFHSWLTTTPLIGSSSIFLGQVTESGQLALTIPLAVGILYQELAQKSRHRQIYILLLSAFITSGFILYSFRSSLHIPNGVASGVALASLLLSAIPLAYQFRPNRELSSSTSLARLFPSLLATCQLPLLITTLVINLKRGPWLGVFSALVVFCFLVSKRLVIAVVAGAVIASKYLPPVYERLVESYQHFTISGGRSTIWRIGVELISEYPLGVGYHNSGILRRFSTEIPESLKHFHNNFLNITAETGWLGLACFVWFLSRLLQTSFRKGAPALSIAIGCGIISWQMAGLVEYNFGDSEITIIVWMLVGFLIQSKRSGPSNYSQSR